MNKMIKSVCVGAALALCGIDRLADLKPSCLWSLNMNEIDSRLMS